MSNTQVDNFREGKIVDPTKLEPCVTIRILKEFGFAISGMNSDCAGSQSFDR
jgi:hypothetical protein